MRELEYDMSLEEIHTPRDESPTPSLDDDDYMEQEIECPDCGREGPRYEIEGHSCGLEPAA